LQQSQPVQLNRSYAGYDQSTLTTTSTSSSERAVLQQSQPVQLDAMINCGYADCSNNSSQLATSSTSSAERVVLQHSQPTQPIAYRLPFTVYVHAPERIVLQHSQPIQQVIYHLLHGMCSHPFAVFRHMSNRQSAVPLPEPAEPTSSSSIFSSLLAPSCLEIGLTVLGSCGFAELLFGTAGPPPDCNHD
jgi:hypothetical protein